MKGPYQQGDVLLMLGGVASQQVANMFVKSLIIRAARRLTAVPASVKGQKASLAAAYFPHGTKERFVSLSVLFDRSTF